MDLSSGMGKMGVFLKPPLFVITLTVSFLFLAQTSPVFPKPFSYKCSFQCNADAEGSDRRIS